MAPFQSLNDNQAIRGFSQSCVNPEVPFSKFPKEYSLFRLGKYNDATGQFENTDPAPVLITTAVQAIQGLQENERYVQSLHLANNANNQTPERPAVNGHETESVQSDSQH